MRPKIGDLVQLKSGGPVMTVYEDNGYETVQVTWFHIDGEIRRLAFAPAVLNTITQSFGSHVTLPSNGDLICGGGTGGNISNANVTGGQGG
jgi:uncharacterized protein YodC (DUF2158 family)